MYWYLLVTVGLRFGTLLSDDEELPELPDEDDPDDEEPLDDEKDDEDEELYFLWGRLRGYYCVSL